MLINDTASNTHLVADFLPAEGDSLTLGAKGFAAEENISLASTEPDVARRDTVSGERGFMFFSSQPTTSYST